MRARSSRAGKLVSECAAGCFRPRAERNDQRSLALYLFRQYVTAGSQFTLVRNGETLYSGSGYDIERLLGGETEKTVSIEGKQLFLAAGREYTADDNTYQIFLLRDHSSVWSITALTWRFLFSSALRRFLLSARVIMFCVPRAEPAQKRCSRAQQSIAGGVYDRRIQRVKRHGRDCRTCREAPAKWRTRSPRMLPP